MAPHLVVDRRVAAVVAVVVVAGKPVYTHASRAIVFNGDDLLVVERNKFGKRYRTLVGGRVEPGESYEEALIREVAEETTMLVGSPRHVFDEIVPEFFVVQHIFVCEYISGEPELAPDSEEYAIGKDGKNTYKPVWLPFQQILEELPDFPFITQRLIDEIKIAKEEGFTHSVKEWTH